MPTLAVTPATVAVGGSAVAAGSGYGSRRTVTLYVGLATVASFRSTRAGTFSRTLTAPGATALVKASSSAGSASATLTVTAPAPTPVPPTTATLYDDFTTLDPRWASNYRPSGLPRTQMDAALVSVSGGLLHLRAEKRADGLWYSSSVDTKLSFKQLYGLFEARIKVPKGRGLWPAGPWGYDDATGQEIDGMEILANPVGTMDADHDVQCLHMTVHPNGTTGYGLPLHTGTDLSADFHVHAFEWRADHIAWFLDGVEKHRYTGTGIPNVALPVILDLGVSGWAGPTDATTPSPSEMLVDWVRVSP